MSETIKVVMEIPKETYLEIRDGLSVRNAIASAEAIQNGVTIGNVKAEIDKACEDFDGYDPAALGSFKSKVFEILDNIGKGE